MITTVETDAGMLWEQEAAREWEALKETDESQAAVFNNLKSVLADLKKCMKGLEDAANTAEGSLLDHVGSYLIDVEDLYDQMNSDIRRLMNERGYGNG